MCIYLKRKRILYLVQMLWSTRRYQSYAAINGGTDGCNESFNLDGYCYLINALLWSFIEENVVGSKDRAYNEITEM